ncbi:hypothetical protein ACQUZK_08870, partial [Streptococcus pyogenes]|uniref:hypothetical protein n=1 Tax=Streptococcus pyogenes TaxID=1314 RepID=UPI003DA0DDC7
MAICLFYVGLGNGYLITQFVVRFQSSREPDHLTRAVFTLLLAFVAVTVLLTGLAIAGAHALQVLGDVGYCLSVLTASILGLARTFYQRYAYSAGVEIVALRMNLAWAGCILVGTGLLAQHNNFADAESTLWIYSAASFVAVLIGASAFTIRFDQTTRSEVGAFITDASRGGLWATLGVIVTSLQSQAYVYVTAVLLGPAALGLANAARMLITPFTSILPAFTNMMLPRLVQAQSANGDSLRSQGIRYSLLLVLSAIFYFVALALLDPYASSALVGNNYE